jgi:hypothetical protein
MRTPQWLESDITYVRNLAEAGVNGVSSVWNRPGDRALAPTLRDSVSVGTAIGGAIGILSILLARRRRSGYGTALGGLVGCAIGFGGGVAWASRDFTGAAARSVIHRVNAVREARWLEKNPIDYA